MSLLSEWIEKRFRRRAREWLLDAATSQAILAAPAVQEWLATQSARSRAAVIEALPRILAAIADNWFGG